VLIAKDPGAIELTKRQREVLALVAIGEPDKAIARRLGITERAVRFHIAASRAHLGARTRTHLIAIAFMQDLIDLRAIDLDQKHPNTQNDAQAIVACDPRRVAQLTRYWPRGPAAAVETRGSIVLVVSREESRRASSVAQADAVVSADVVTSELPIDQERCLAASLLACLRAEGVARAVVEPDFPLLVADLLRAASITLVVRARLRAG